MTERGYRIILVISFAMLSVGARAQVWSAPFLIPETLGHRLERVYSALLVTCNPGQTKLVKKTCNFLNICSAEDLSAVPDVIQRQAVLPLVSKVIWNDRQSIGRAFALVYMDARHFGGTDILSDKWLLYNYGLEESAKRFLPEGVARGVSIHDCGGVLTAASQANVGLELPLAQVRGALTASYAANRKTSLATAYGKFDSPFFSMWSSGIPEQQVEAGLKVFEWYTKYKHTGNEKLLRSINRGMAIFSIDESTRNIAADANLEASVSGVIGSAGITGKSSAQQSSTVTIKDFQIATAFKNGSDEPDVEFNSLPQPKEVADLLASITPQLDETTLTQAVPGTRVVHGVVVKGVDKSYCTDEKRVWGIESKDADIKLASTKWAKSADGSNSCVFMVEYRVPIEYSGPGVDSFALTYAIKTDKSIADSNGNVYFPQFNSNTVRYIVNRSPEIFSTTAVPEPVFSDGTLTWKAELIFREDAGAGTRNAVDWTRQVLATSVISCVGDQVPDTSAVIDPARKTGSLSVTLSGKTAEQVDEWSGGMNNLIRCRAKVTLNFRTTDFSTLSRDFTFPIRFPQKKVFQ